MNWSDVGQWLKTNAGPGAALVGSLVAGNAPAAIAAGVALVKSATGVAEPEQALQALQQDPQTVVRLRELANQEAANIRQHIEAMERLSLDDAQAQHATTQATIQAGDKADDRLVRWTRPLQSWASLLAAFFYVFNADQPTFEIVLALLSLPWAYAGLRQIGKGVDSVAGVMKLKGR